MHTMLQRYPDKAGALGQIHCLPAMLHVKALLHASRAHQRAVAPLQHRMHNARACRPPAKPPPQMPNHWAVEALQPGINVLSGRTNTHCLTEPCMLFLELGRRREPLQMLPHCAAEALRLDRCCMLSMALAGS